MLRMEPTRAGRTRATLGFLLNLLFRDPRVTPWPKALLVGALAYVILPFDVIPDMLPVIGEVDDLVIVIVAARWFIQWCPPEVVREHVQAIDRRYEAAL